MGVEVIAKVGTLGARGWRCGADTAIPWVVPEFVELGIGDSLNNAFSLWAPPGTTAAQLGQWRQAIRTALLDAALRSLLEDKLAFSVAYKDGETVTSELMAHAREWGPRLRAAR